MRAVGAPGQLSSPEGVVVTNTNKEPPRVFVTSMSNGGGLGGLFAVTPFGNLECAFGQANVCSKPWSARCEPGGGAVVIANSSSPHGLVKLALEGGGADGARIALRRVASPLATAVGRHLVTDFAFSDPPPLTAEERRLAQTAAARQDARPAGAVDAYVATRASADDSSCVRRHDLATGKVLAERALERGRHCNGIDVGPANTSTNGDLFVVDTRAGEILRFDRETLRPLPTFASEGLTSPNLCHWVDVDKVFALRWRRRRGAMLLSMRTTTQQCLLARLAHRNYDVFKEVISFL